MTLSFVSYAWNFHHFNFCFVSVLCHIAADRFKHVLGTQISKISNVNVKEREELIPFVFIHLCHSIAVYVLFKIFRKLFAQKMLLPARTVLSCPFFVSSKRKSDRNIFVISIYRKRSHFFFAYSTLCIGIVDVRQMNFTPMT